MTARIERIMGMAGVLGKGNGQILLSQARRDGAWQLRFLNDGATSAHEYFALGTGDTVEEAFGALEMALAEKVKEKLAAIDGQRRTLAASLNGGADGQ